LYVYTRDLQAVILHILDLTTVYLLIIVIEVIVAPDHITQHTHTHTQSVRLLWSRDRSISETSTWHHTALTRQRYLCPRRDSNPQSQQASGRRPTY